MEKYGIDTSQEQFDIVIKSIPIGVVSLAQSLLSVTSLPVTLSSPTIAGIPITDKRCNNAFIRNQFVPVSTPVCKHRWTLMDKKLWNLIFLLPYQYIIANKIKEILFKIVHRYYPSKENTCRFLPTVSNVCTFCGCDGETFENIFVDCIHVTSFWFHLQRYISRKIKKDIFLSKFEILLIVTNPNVTANEKYIINLIIILAKYYLHQMLWQKIKPSFYNVKITELKTYWNTIEKLIIINHFNLYEADL